MQPKKWENAELRNSLVAAVETALTRDFDLIALGAHEQAIAHRIAVYLENDFIGYHVDCEYNRRKHRSKAYNLEEGEAQANMRPDIIVHIRNEANSNLLAVEIKANANNKKSNDAKKLVALQAAEEGYCYQEVAFIRILNGLNDIAKGELFATIAWYNDNHEPEDMVTVQGKANKEQVVAIAKLRDSESKH